MSPARNAGHQARPPDFSPREFRASLGMFATGVTIVTARTASGELAGLTASSFNSVSLDPPLVLWSLAQAAGSMAAFANGQHYAINVLAADQQPLAERFAARGLDRWAGVDFSEGGSGAPLLRIKAAGRAAHERVIGGGPKRTLASQIRAPGEIPGLRGAPVRTPVRTTGAATPSPVSLQAALYDPGRR